MDKPENPAFLVLTLRSCDASKGERLTMAGPVGGLPGLSLLVTLAYDARIAALPFLARVAVDMNGTQREFAVLSVAPAPSATATEVVVTSLRPRSEWSGTSSHRMSFKMPVSWKEDLEQLQKILDLHRTTQPVATGAGQRFTSN